MNSQNKQIVSQVIPVTILLLAVYSVAPFFTPGIPLSSLLHNTTLWWSISAMILTAFFLARYYYYDKRNEDNMLIVWIYLFWNLVCIVRGMFVAEIYWDWKGLIGNTLALMLPVVIFSATNKMVVQSLLSHFVKYALPLFLVFALLIRPDAFGLYLMPMSFLLLFLPALTKRQKILVLGIAAVVFFADLGARSSVIKFFVPLFILSFYYLRHTILAKVMELTRILLFILPLLFFVLAVTDVFNIFKIDEYLKEDYTAMATDMEGNVVEMNMVVDTRTFIYEEILESAVHNNYWLLGRTPARGNDSDSFGVFTAELTGRNERLSNEIGLANVFTWTGLLGVILYSFIFYRASFLAVNRSKSIYARLLGIYVAFRWLYSWVEDINNFSLNYFMLMIMIGLCFSESFRRMTMKDVTIWVRGVFDVRYMRLLHYLLKKSKNEKREFGSLANLPQQEK